MKKVALDARDRAIIDGLLEDSRASQQSLATRAGITPPAVRERVRRLEDEGVIEAFTIEVGARSLGYTLEAIVRIEPLPGKLHIVERALQDTPEVIQCDTVTGDDCFIARMVLRDIQDLNRLLEPLHDKARTNTSIVKGNPVPRRRPPFWRGRSKRSLICLICPGTQSSPTHASQTSPPSSPLRKLGGPCAAMALTGEQVFGHEIDEHTNFRREIAAGRPQHPEDASFGGEFLQDRAQRSIGDLLGDREMRQAGNSEPFFGKIDQRFECAGDGGGGQ